MRKDMAKVIVERPRYVGLTSRRGVRLPATEELPTQESMRRPHVLSRLQRNLSDNLQPLRRYLARQVGRPWNKVYSEITDGLRIRSTLQQHLRDHIADFVELHPRHRTMRNASGERIRLLWHAPFYVDRRSGLLKRTDSHPFAKPRRGSRQGQE